MEAPYWLSWLRPLQKQIDHMHHGHKMHSEKKKLNHPCHIEIKIVSLAVTGGKNKWMMGRQKWRITGQKRMWDQNSKSESFAWSVISSLPSFPPCMVLHFSQWHPWLSNRIHEWALVTDYGETERWGSERVGGTDAEGRIERWRGAGGVRVHLLHRTALVSSSELITTCCCSDWLH